MVSHFSLQSTSRDSALVEDMCLDPPDEERQSLTRRILRVTLVNNVHDASDSVKACIMHQRRARKDVPWQDVESFSLATMKSGQQIKLQLSAKQTKALYERLDEMYQVSAEGVPQGERRFIVVDEDEVVPMSEKAKATIQLIEQRGDEFWDAVDKLKPDLLIAVALKRQHEVRTAVLDRFRIELERGVWSEGEWQRLFEDNTWIFGHGLAYQFLEPVTPQPSYGGLTVSGTGSQRGDYLMATRAHARFTVLVEIKTPKSLLVTDKTYRNKVHEPGPDLIGGVAQLQSNCRTWIVEGSRQEDNIDSLEQQDVYTYEPKGILVIGNTNQLIGNRGKRATFELFRRNLRNPEVLTFDELYARAEYLVKADPSL